MAPCKIAKAGSGPTRWAGQCRQNRPTARIAAPCLCECGVVASAELQQIAMEPAQSRIQVRHNRAASRYEAEVDGHLAVAEYEQAGDRVVFTHTYVPPDLRGRGIAGQLVRTALEEARRAGRRVEPRCPYVKLFIRRNPEFQPLLACDDPSR